LVGLGAALVGLLAQPVCAAGQQATAAKPQRPGVKATNCGEGISARVSPVVVGQGGLALVDVRSKEGLSSVKGKWGEHEVGFWKEPESGQGTHWRGLLGVDLERAAGPQEMTLFATKSGGSAVGCGLEVTVRLSRFPTERIKVENQFVEPNQGQAARAKQEQDRLRVIYETVTPEKLWHGRFRLPLDGVNTGGNFGRRRVLNGKAGSPHGGVDFPALTGTPVHASQAGKVVLA